MTKAGFLSVVVLGILQAVTPAAAQSLRNAGPPAEFPPDDFAGNQYVDSRGCVYIRAGIGSTTNWVPRVNRQREVLCGFQPSLGPAPQPEPAAPTATAEAPAAEPAPAPAATTTPVARPAQQTAAATPAPAPRRPAQPPASFTPPPTLITSAPSSAPALVPATPRSPVITRVTGTSTIAAPSLVRDGATAEPQPARQTRSQFCEGRFGLQPGFVSSRTGETINCGPRPASTQVAAVAPVTPSAPGVRRATRAEICAEMRATGQRFMNASTGLPIRCPVDPIAAQVASAPATAPVTSAQVARAGCDNFTGISAQYVLNNAGVRCGPQTQDPVFGSNTPVSVPRVSTKSATNPFNPQVPASNPTYVRDPNPAPPHGYEHVWDDGRLNPHRGLPAGGIIVAPQLDARVSTRATAPAPATATAGTTLTEARVSTRTVAPPSVTAPSHPYVQVATFTDRDQAQDLAKALRARGLPMRIAVYSRDGAEHRIVLAGPFASQSALDRALGQVRGAGYGSARPARY